MSSFPSSGSVLPKAALQLAPIGENGPDFVQLKEAFQKVAFDCQAYISQTAQNFCTRYALWAGQSADGKKHSRGPQGMVEPVPWDGASDMRVLLVDNLINKKVAMKCMAVKKANLVAVPIEGNDIKRAKVVSNFMRWLIQTQMPDVDREMELLAQYLEEKGLALTGQFWETTQENILQTLRLTDFQAQFPDIDMQQLLDSGDVDDYLKSIFEEIYGCTRAKAGKMLKELAATGITTVAIVGKEKSRPVMRAFNLDNDLFIPPDTTDIEMATGIYRVQYYTPEALRSKVNTEGWDKNWVENAIATAKGAMLSILPAEYMQPLGRSFVYTQQRFTDKIGVVWAYQRLSDEDGVPGIYLTIFSPNVPASTGGTTAPSMGGSTWNSHKGYAKFGLYGDSDGQYPFILHRREFLSRKIHDSRGLPEPLKPYQDTVKAHMDSRIDTASLNILPPLMYPIGRPPLKWGAGARVPERRPNEYHHNAPVPFDETTEASLQTLNDTAKNYVGFGGKDDEQAINPLENQFETDKFLGQVSKAYRQIWALWKKFGNPEVYFRVIGLQNADPTLMERGPEDEQFDFYLSFDVLSQDYEKMQEKITGMMQLAQAMDRTGAVDWTEFLQVALELADPNIAQRVLQPAAVGTAKVVDDVQGDLTKLFSGVSVNLKPNTPPQIAQQTVQNYFMSPDVQGRYQADEAFRTRMDAYIKQIQMVSDQQQNQQIGRLGAVQPTPVINGS